MANTVITQDGNISVISNTATNVVSVVTQGPQGPAGPIGNIDTSSFATTGSNNFVGNQVITGSLTVSGSGNYTNGLTVTGSVSLSSVLTLAPQHPLPASPVVGTLAISASIPPRPYFWDGTIWYAL